MHRYRQRTQKNNRNGKKWLTAARSPLLQRGVQRRVDAHHNLLITLASASVMAEMCYEIG